jgi:hypothetical protein
MILYHTLESFSDPPADEPLEEDTPRRRIGQKINM